MFELIGGIFSFAFGMVKMGLGLAWGMVRFIFGLLGGVFSLVMSLGGIMLAGALILLAVFRRKDRKQQSGHPYADNTDKQETRTYDVDGEEFTSFYDQYRNEE